MGDSEPQLVAGREAADDENDLVAGRKRAPKVGGMRIPQHHHKSTNAKTNKDEVMEDVTGLAPKPNITADVVSGAKVQGDADYTPEAAQVAHKAKPPNNFASQRSHNINQPRK